MQNIRAFNGDRCTFSLDPLSMDCLDHCRQSLASIFNVNVSEGVILRLALQSLVYEFDDIITKHRTTKAGTLDRLSLINRLTSVGQGSASMHLAPYPACPPWPTWEERKQTDAVDTRRQIRKALGIKEDVHKACEKYPEGCESCPRGGNQGD